MKYSKELHYHWKQYSKDALNDREFLSVSPLVITALLDEIERLQAENERLSGWVDNVCKTAKCWSIYPPPPDAS